MIDTTQYKALLEEEQKTLVSELANLGVENPSDGDWEAVPIPAETGETSDENDVADRFEDYEERSATLNTLEKRLSDVTLALKKIADGTYGICEISGEPIEEDRLTANPAARTCKKHLEN